MVLRRNGKVLLLQRSMTMPFAPGMYVFPGGGVSSADRETDDPLRTCAIRETREEVDIVVGDCMLFDRWVTPEIEDRRYDVCFFIADVDQEGRLVTTEADRIVWMSPSDAIEQHAQGGLPLLRPTLIVLENLASDLVDSSVVVPVPKLPRLRPDGLWDVVDADSGSVLITVDDGPTILETEGVGGS